uniref:Mitochondrial import inner membrane translocase subunit TIM9 n=1 Tax=Coccidioides posadasii RMSCC 3488 TaxID=454284 RepID=A0A0J6F0G3_COCPO|nr:mitochondrial import inner membrane translocase subunit tim9 [Coccidioides posadasii RMSCC 3488]
MDGLTAAEQQELQKRMEKKQIKEFMGAYSMIVNRCFDDCINDFTTKSLISREEGCVNRCFDKFMKTRRARQPALPGARKRHDAVRPDPPADNPLFLFPLFALSASIVLLHYNCTLLSPKWDLETLVLVRSPTNLLVTRTARHSTIDTALRLARTKGLPHLFHQLSCLIAPIPENADDRPARLLSSRDGHEPAPPFSSIPRICGAPI